MPLVSTLRKTRASLAMMFRRLLLKTMTALLLGLVSLQTATLPPHAARHAAERMVSGLPSGPDAAWTAGDCELCIVQGARYWTPLTVVPAFIRLPLELSRGAPAANEPPVALVSAPPYARGPPAQA